MSNNKIRVSVEPFYGLSGVVLRVFINGNENMEYYKISNPTIELCNDIAIERKCSIEKSIDSTIKWSLEQ